ncbi:SMUG2 DNA glycosylase family protein [Mucilaginibacter ginsenosidivorans]|uniref:SMUG2 DNA glycosylase family protein n=1 Tax=Mucilaginibacter ginsenosidivorans TaxID=398053 RepID=A0A5B8UQC5_9SPHI|nr:SMUG2 DNA glycosylase family protein [Mucilaginibacter ginsenosidivorans]QEC61277.1 SMUG2 DNA glycosylase family protein [Mucilaginibacter ginsenosidivorans]
MTFAEKVIRFNENLHYTGPTLPEGIRIMNPFREFEQTKIISEAFYRKYYSDANPRHLIMGINPGRFGAGLTGVPFTDPKRLVSECHIPYQGKVTHEPSSVFVYEMINAYGGPEQFYGKFYINSLCPLGFTSADEKGREKNYNYYDNPALAAAVSDFITENVRTQIGLGVKTDVVFCFGTGKNESYLRKLNDKYHFFDKVIALEHPRFIMQYKARTKQIYINKYLEAFASVG